MIRQCLKPNIPKRLKTIHLMGGLQHFIPKAKYHWTLKDNTSMRVLQHKTRILKPNI